jgi:hypothetical protein
MNKPQDETSAEKRPERSLIVDRHRNAPGQGYPNHILGAKIA